MEDRKHIIFFDGVCNFCHGFIRFITARDKKGIFYCAPLQGRTARELLKDEALSLEYLIYFKQGRLFRGIAAVQEISKTLFPSCKYVWAALPHSFWGFFYRWIAKRRYKIFGKKDQWQPPEKGRFLP